MDTYGVNVLHRADGDSRVVLVAHNLELNLLVALDALLYEHLVDRRQCQGVTHNVAQLLLVVSETTTCTTECKRGTQYYGVANLLCCLDTLLDRVCDA